MKKLFSVKLISALILAISFPLLALTQLAAQTTLYKNGSVKLLDENGQKWIIFPCQVFKDGRTDCNAPQSQVVFHGNNHEWADFKICRTDGGNCVRLLDILPKESSFDKLPEKRKEEIKTIIKNSKKPTT